MASQDQDRQASELLRRSLAAPVGAPDSEIDACPDPEILAAYSERSLDKDEATRLNMHFSQCARCREQLVVLVRARDSAGTTEEKRPRTPGMVWDWRWLAPAAAAIIFVVVVQVFRPPHRAGEQPLVAMNQPSELPNANTVPGPPPAADSLGQTSPNSNSTKSEIEPRAKASPPSRDDHKEFGSSEPVKNGPAAPKADASSRSESEVGYAAGIAAAPPPPTPTVTVEGAVSSATPAATAPAVVAAPEKKSAQANGAGSAAGTVTQETINGQQLSVDVANRKPMQNQMVRIEASDVTTARMLVRSPDPQVLWRFSSGRFVERSSDAGATWHVQWTNANAHLVAGAAPSSDSCWIVGRGAMVLLTTDGKKWKRLTPPANADFVGVAATDASSATVTAADNHKFTTNDGGKHWTPAP